MRAPLALILPALLLGGCAKFPTTDSTNEFTRLHFDFTMAGAVNPNYVYLIAIRPVFNGDSTAINDGHGPRPVQTYGGNGFVEGYPTRYVIYKPDEPDKYALYRFLSRKEAPPINDPDSPVNLLQAVRIQTKYGGILTGTGIDPTTSGDPKTLGFDLTTRELTDNDDDARNLQAIQFNILTMNKVAQSSGESSGRVFDALGNGIAAIYNPAYRQINTGISYRNDATIETENDVLPEVGPSAPLDIVGWNLSVRLP